jgi:SH3 domain protein
LARVVLVGLACATLATSAAAETAWVRGAALNLRSGAGNQYRILATAQPGARVDILERTEKWTKVRAEDGKEGWISAGYLDPTPPPTRRVAQLEQELARTKTRLETTTGEAETLRTSQAELSSSDAEQRAAIERLTEENYELRGGERWREWFTGACILALGMVAGGILSRSSARRRGNRLRL